MIVSVDPGKACGLVAIKQDGTAAHRLEGDPFTCVNKVEYLLGAVRPIAVVAERYVQQSGKMTFQPEALEVIGALRYLCKRANVSFTLQSRSERVRVTRDMLVELGLWNPRVVSPHGHMNEAAKHAVVYIVQHIPHHPIAKKLLGTILLGEEAAAIGVNDGLRREA